MTSKASPVLVERQANILAAVVREYIQTAEPVGSQTLVERYFFEVSPATIRNDMAALEEGGYLESPHHSAGRVPTDQSYRYYVRHFLRPTELSSREEQELKSLVSDPSTAGAGLKLVARAVASYSSESAFLAFGKTEVYHTGFARLFQQPEFREFQQISDLGAIIDQFDEVVESVFEEIPDEVVVMVGSENPFGEACSVIVGRFEASALGAGLFGMLGPTRMDYDTNLTRVKYVHDLLDTL